MESPHNDRESIKQALRDRGTNLAQIARRLGVRNSAMTQALDGYNRSRRIESAIATALGTTPEALWPERYPSQEAA